jgi:DNA invertase Pin-like site-specific DNA recombinase
LKVAKYIKLEISDPNSSRQTIKHTPEGIRYLEVVDKCSSRRAFQDREFGKNIIRLGSSGEIDTLLVNSITYLGKNGLDILKTIKILTDLNVNVKAEKENLETINKDGSKNTTLLALVNMMASIYQHEEKIKLEKQKQGIHSAKSKGVYKKNGGKRKIKIVFWS